MGEAVKLEWPWPEAGPALEVEPLSLHLCTSRPLGLVHLRNSAPHPLKQPPLTSVCSVALGFCRGGQHQGELQSGSLEQALCPLAQGLRVTLPGPCQIKV